MNNFPRIKELKIQACKWASENASSAEYENAADQKFAELIVRECMEQVWYTREDGINGNVSEVIKERMKEHFGVEE
jgi:hypothetical protein